MSPIVCGFGDAAAGLGGLAWDIGAPGAVLLSDGAAQAGSFAIEEGGDAATLELTAGELTLEATLTPHTADVPLGQGLTFSACAAEVRPAGGNETFACSGYIARWGSDPLEGSGTFRQLAIERGGESFLVVTAQGAPGAGEHGSERTAGWLFEGENATPFEESLISTQYDAAGTPTRFGLELWPEDADQSSRAAATRVSGSSLGVVSSGSISAGLFRCHADGAEGFGSYLLFRR